MKRRKNILIILEINALFIKGLRFEDLSCKTCVGGFGLDIGGPGRHESVLVVVFVGRDLGGFALAASSGGSFLGFWGGGFAFAGLRGC